ncbi:hypothetical protein [Deinococcus cellulosilyticus]|uniref:Uncharacterized protein n=1 Tax=Deinococcus cellulosilyticus (strain DSM 18568 / NBRC 106333 / KACC 11606 / 5516J-15) TaxID=1223518 RepID=A0A511N6S1_DEIC1|nr:hypothetical protein [Deinococcus cellulosilyticus]GEM48111.1 hypothetical protein DC3_37460 [Deinococcus cellulosilyticus NBRC 106333 = KACC 11606]
MKILQTIPLDRISDPVMAMAVFMQQKMDLDILQVTENEVHLGSNARKQHMFTLKSSFHNQVLFIWVHHYRADLSGEEYLSTAIHLPEFSEALRSNTLIQFIQQQTQLQFHEYSEALRKITDIVRDYLHSHDPHLYITRRTLISLIMAIHYESHADFRGRFEEIVHQDIIDLYENKLYFKYHIQDMKAMVNLFEDADLPGPLKNLYILFDLQN